MSTHVIESDICILGAGITGILLAEKLSREKPELKIALIDAGKKVFDAQRLMERRKRYLAYGENPWPGDHVKDHIVLNAESQTMAVGGWALHWTGEASRASSEEVRLKSLYGIATDWPLSWQEMEKHYCEAEKAIGVCGEDSPYIEDKRSEPFPMPAMPLSITQKQIKNWAEKSGLRLNIAACARNSVEYAGRSQCHRCDTCNPVCPSGARFSPVHTLNRLLAGGRVKLYDNVLVRRLFLSEHTDQVAEARGVNADASTEDEYIFRAKTFALALGKYWSPHLLLMSACDRFPKGLANKNGLVGRHMSTWLSGLAAIKLDRPIYSGMHDNVFTECREFYRCPTDQEYLRYSITFSGGYVPYQIFKSKGGFPFGDNLWDAWKRQRDVVLAVTRYDMHGKHESGITYDTGLKNHWGDPMPAVKDVFDEASVNRQPRVEKSLVSLAKRLAGAGGGKIMGIVPVTDYGSYWRLGGCRMATDANSGVCNSYGRTFDHENLFVVGAPTVPTPGLGGITVMFSALTMRSADEILRSV